MKLNKSTLKQSRCSAKTKAGNACRAPAVYGTEFCALHGDPARAAEIGRKGGRKNRHYVDVDPIEIPAPKTPGEAMQVLAQTIADLRARKVDPRIASAIIHGVRVFLYAMDITDLHSRLERLEQNYANGGAGEMEPLREPPPEGGTPASDG